MSHHIILCRYSFRRPSNVSCTSHPSLLALLASASGRDNKRRTHSTLFIKHAVRNGVDPSILALLTSHSGRDNKRRTHSTWFSLHAIRKGVHPKISISLISRSVDISKRRTLSIRLFRQAAINGKSKRCFSWFFQTSRCFLRSCGKMHKFVTFCMSEI